MPSPVMDQYARIKREHPGEILLFRMGDFYEMFHDDARTCSEVLGIALTSRSKGDKKVPMAGVPHHSAQSYINRLLRAGHRVAVCEQLQDAEEAKGIVDRGVVRVITPGTLIEEEGLLEETRNNFLASIAFDGDTAGLAWVDLSTGLFRVEDVRMQDLEDELNRLEPSETLVTDADEERVDRIRPFSGIVTPHPDYAFDPKEGRRELCEHFGTKNLGGFGCDDLKSGLGAAGAILGYLRQTQKGVPRQITRLARHVRTGRVYLDRQTKTSLELTETMRGGNREGSLLGILDRSRTPMGARLLRDWITSPLREREGIEERLDAVGELHERSADVREKLKGFGDLERTLSRIGSGRAGPRDLGALRDSLKRLPPLRDLKFEAALLKRTVDALGKHDELEAKLTDALVDQPPVLLHDGGIFRKGYDEELDKLRDAAAGGKDWLAEFERRQIERTGISTLKVGYNRVFGYYIEVTHLHTEKVPADFIRKQTLKNAERYITPELKEHETTVLSAEEKSKKREAKLFTAMREEAAGHMKALQNSATAVASLDVLASLAEVAREHNYVRPSIEDSGILDIQDGRHPVVEQLIEERFIPNHTRVGDKTKIMLITGPNMAGKSTYIRQVALLTLLAQMGSFVPAKKMKLGIVDRIFTRVGAADELARGASTFMVEMNETANILNHATDRSLVILDEIGRGTSTFDGLSIAWAVTEYLHEKLKARTLFATHYHELTGLSEVRPAIRNHHIAVREWGESIVFLHEIREGATDKSYGIHVARLAGIPQEVVTRAKQILEGLEEQAQSTPSTKPTPGELLQMSLFDKPKEKKDPLREELEKLDPDQMTPLQALQKLQEWKKK